MQSSLVKGLLNSAQSHVPALGFTIQAIQAGAQQSGIASSSTVMQLFPSHAFASRSLLKRFDELYWDRVAVEQKERPLRGKSEQNKALEEAVDLLEQKLLVSAPIKHQLPDALGALISPLSPRLPITIPNPSPVLHRAYSIADEALHLAGWTGKLKTDWYTKRLALTKSFMLAELHMISPEQLEDADISTSIQLFRRLSPKLKSQESYQNSFPDLTRWASWASHGWLGILRSRGL